MRKKTQENFYIMCFTQMHDMLGSPRRDGELAAITASRQIALSDRRLARKMGKQQLLAVVAALW